jgi:NADPH-dependent 2,4-dienoyl-CoA reductase/sulfur reductase-like enzyme
MPTLRTIAVVGASLAGLRAVEALRREGYEGRLILVGDETHLPYDRPPLSKQILRGEWETDKLALRRGSYDELELDLRLGTRAVELDPGQRRLRLADGSTLDFDGLVIATGAKPRSLRGVPPLDGVHLLRSLDDALALRSALVSGARVCVVGAGFIGAEVAASARMMGLDVCMVEPLAAPCVRGLGAEMGSVLADVHRDHGVDLRLGLGVEAIEGGERVERVLLSDGSAVAADVVVVGIGVAPATDWLASSGLKLEDGVLCDATCATAVPGVVAAGDVARWHHPVLGGSLRVEHWTNAVEQGVHAAQTLLAGQGAQPFAPVPLFWSDQYDRKIQFAGHAGADDEVQVVKGSVEERRFVALYGRAGRLVGALAFNRARDLVHYRRLLAEGVSYDEALASARAED